MNNENLDNFANMTEKELGGLLKSKERLFCEEYLKCGRKKEAAEKAGYKDPANRATKLLKKAECLAYIRAIQLRAREELGIDDNWAVLRAIDVYRQCMEGTPVLEWDYESHSMKEKGKFQFDSKGAINALKLIQELLGLGNEDKDKLQTAVTIINNLGE